MLQCHTIVSYAINTSNNIFKFVFKIKRSKNLFHFLLFPPKESQIPLLIYLVKAESDPKETMNYVMMTNLMTMMTF